MQQPKRFVTSRYYAEQTGIPEPAVVADVQTNHAWSIVGQPFADYTLVEAWELEDARVAQHRARLSAADMTTAAL